MPSGPRERATSAPTLLVPTKAVPSSEDSVRAIATPAMGSYVISAGTDRRIRYWDLQDAARSFLIAGSGDRDGAVRTSVRCGVRSRRAVLGRAGGAWPP